MPHRKLWPKAEGLFPCKAHLFRLVGIDLENVSLQCVWELQKYLTPAWINRCGWLACHCYFPSHTRRKMDQLPVVILNLTQYLVSLIAPPPGKRNFTWKCKGLKSRIRTAHTPKMDTQTGKTRGQHACISSWLAWQWHVNDGQPCM